MKNISVKTWMPYFAAIIIFIAISVGYFTPDIFQNRTLYQNDVVMGNGASEEVRKFKEETGEKSLWTNSMFGGMPVYQISPTYPSTSVLGHLRNISWLYLPAPAAYLFILLIGAFLLFVALKVNPWLAILGSIAYAFSSYFLVIIEAGHIWKVWTLAYIPPTFAGIIWAYRGKYWLGGSVAALYMALQLYSNHPQMTYYFGLIVLIFVIAKFIDSFKKKELPGFFKASAILVVAVAIAFALNITNMYHTADYSKYSIRGGSELTHNQDNQTAGGLERDYVTSWSYGIGETFTLIVPNTKGGATGILGSEKNTVDKVIAMVQNNPQIPAQAKNSVAENILYANSYWGDQPSTAGPVYAGAFIIFLFVLGIFIVRGWFKWVLVIATGLSIMLAWGSNFMGLTNLFLDYFPYYNKLRAVSSMLVIAELCIPVLAILALKEIIENPSVIKEKKKRFYISLGATGGLTLLFIIAPTLFFSFLSQNEVNAYAEVLNNPQTASIYSEIIDGIESIRISIFRADALRSLVIICLGVALLMLYGMKKINVKLLLVAVTALVLFDMWQVDKRYLNSDKFHPKARTAGVFQKTPVDEEILKDKDLDYRVYNLSLSPFQDATTSFYHKSIGGYHGAKLRRFQDLIEHYIGRISAQNAQGLLNTQYFDVLNMLNTKYIILPGENNTKQLLRNPNALGNAWFIEEIVWVDNADQEIAALAEYNPAKVAIIDKRFETPELKDFKPNIEEIAVSNIDGDSTNISGNDAHFFDNSSIKLVEYAPNKLVYESKTISSHLAVFSEIYYPKGWQAYIDGQEVPILRANYILRAMLIPEGKHTIEFRFDPGSYHLTERLAWIGYILLLGMVIVTIILGFIKKRKEENTVNDK